MKKKVLIFVILIFPGFSFSQTSNNIDLGSIAVLLQNSTGSGSGFYLQDTSKHYIYLVTACHVIVNQQNGKFFEDSLLFISYKKNSQRDSRDSFKLNLPTAYKMGALKFNVNKDVAVIMFAFEEKKSITYLPFVKKITKSNTYINSVLFNDIKRINELNTMSHVYTIGYPKSLSLNINFDFNRPLVRGGIISGIDLVKNKIIVDCPTYPGNSGGLVFEAEPFQNKLYLIGLVSQFVPFEEHWINEAYGYYNTNVYNSGYTVVIPFDSILEQIELIAK